MTERVLPSHEFRSVIVRKRWFPDSLVTDRDDLMEDQYAVCAAIFNAWGVPLYGVSDSDLMTLVRLAAI